MGAAEGFRASGGIAGYSDVSDGKTLGVIAFESMFRVNDWGNGSGQIHQCHHREDEEA